MGMRKNVKAFSLTLLVVLALVYILHRSWLAESQSNQLDIRKLCFIIDWSNPRYCSPSEKDTITFGRPFNMSSSLLRDLGIPKRGYVPITRENLDDFVFATAASKDYFHVAMDAIGNIQRLLPTYTIYFYDLDVSRPQRDIFKIKSLCNVKYRKFNYSRYPAHVSFLQHYAFKPLIVHEMLAEFPRVFWIDSSVRFKTQNLSLTLDEVFTSGGILTFEQSNHSNFEATNEGMYQFLPISASAAANTAQYGANSIYLHRTEEMYTRIIFWWVLCALRVDCIAPIKNLRCIFKRKDVWAGCHRFDQAALNILMANHFHYNVSRYTSRHGQVDVRRNAAHQELLIVCPTEIRIKSAKYFS